MLPSAESIRRALLAYEMDLAHDEHLQAVADAEALARLLRPVPPVPGRQWGRLAPEADTGSPGGSL